MEATLEQTFTKWIATRIDEAVSDFREGYFPIDVVISAYEQGHSIGLKKGESLGIENIKEQVRKKYYEKAQLAFQSISELIEIMIKEEKMPDKLFINHSIEHTSFILLMGEELIEDDEFYESIYKHSSAIENRTIQQDLHINISFADDNVNTNYELLASDGYKFGYDFKERKIID
jgi:hypothetical protein